MKRIESVYFRVDQSDERYPRMARVLEYTARRHCPDYVISIREVKAPITHGHKYRQRSFATNSDKLDHWNGIVQAAPDGDQIALLDSDMFIVRTLDPIWDDDAAITVTGYRPIRMPFNGGAVFLRIGDVARQFMIEWADVNARMMRDGNFHQPYRAKYGGMNQAALGYLIEERGWQPRVVPTAEWNNCDIRSWPQWHESRIVHVKSSLRRTIFSGRRAIATSLSDCVAEWHRLELEAASCAA